MVFFQKTVSLFLVIFLVASLAACGQAPVDPTITPVIAPHETTVATEAVTEAPSTEAPTESVTVDEGLLTVELTYTFEYWGLDDPASFDPEECTRFWGIDETRIDMDNDTITIVMTKRRQQEILAESVAGIDEMISNYLNSEHEAYIPSIVSITHDEDLTAFIITVESGADENEYGIAEAMLMFSTAYHHLISGYTGDVVVDTVDASTGEVICEYIY